MALRRVHALGPLTKVLTADAPDAPPEHPPDASCTETSAAPEHDDCPGYDWYPALRSSSAESVGRWA